MPECVLVGDLPSPLYEAGSVEVPQGSWRLREFTPDFTLGLVFITLESVEDD